MSTETTLASTLTLPCGATLPNRLGKSAMTEGIADAHDNPTEGHARLYKRWAEGGTGLLITGNVMVDRRYLERVGNVVLDARTDDAALRRWAQEGRVEGTQLWMQLSHPGRQCSMLVTRRPVAPSPVKLKLGGLFARPRALEAGDIEATHPRTV